MAGSVEAFDGCYEGPRAAALSGVPVSTVYYWASHDVVVPSVSPVREKLWSYADLMALRIVYWLRHPTVEGQREASPMGEIRRALARLDDLGLDIWQAANDAPTPLVVDRAGRIYIQQADGIEDLDGALRIGEMLNLLGPFKMSGLSGPDLRTPRSHLRIVPGKCAGEPHLKGSRLTTLTIAALSNRGFDVSVIAKLYPDENPDAIREALELESQLAHNATAAA